MTKDNETTEKPAAEVQEADATSADAQAARPRKIVRRSASTREHPAFTPNDEAAAAGDAPAEPSDRESTASPEGSKAPEARPRATFDARAPRPRATFDARAPRQPRPAGPPAGASAEGPRRGERPQGGGRPARTSGDYRPPAARPMGARPLPGGPRAPAPEGRPSRPAGDYRPPAARPMGARPLPGGPRAPAPPRQDGRDERRGPGQARPEGAAPQPRPAPPGGVTATRALERAAAAQQSAPAGKAAAPPAPAKSAAAPKPQPRPAALPLTVPLPRAAGGSASNKPAPTAKETLSARAKAANASKTKAPAPKAEAETSARPAQELAPEILNAGQDTAREALQKAGDAAQQLIEAWLGASNAAAIVAVVEADEVPGAARKAARRALNVLRARGVPIPERSHVVKIDDRAEVSIEATLIPSDSSGTCAIAITSRDAAGRYHLAEVIIREPFGIIQAGSGWLSGSQLKEGRTRTLEGLGFLPVPVPVEWARHRIAVARQQNATSGQILPLSLERCRELIEPAPEAEPAHPLAHIEGQVTSERVAEAARDSSSLHLEPEFRSWLPDRGALDELLQKVGERLGPEGAKEPERVNQALREEIEAATDRFFTPEIREILERRMRESAISMRGRKGDERALAVLAVARAVREAGLITSPPREIPFLVGFFQKALGVLASQGGGQLRVPVSPGAATPPPAEAQGSEAPQETPAPSQEASGASGEAG